MKKTSVKIVKLRKSISKEIGNEFKSQRKNMGIPSYEKFAHKYKLPRASYFRIEDGGENLTLESMLKILDIHKISPADFFETIAKNLRKKKNAKQKIN